MTTKKMLVLDTDHLSELDRNGKDSQLYWRLETATEPVVTTIVSAEELIFRCPLLA